MEFQLSNEQLIVLYTNLVRVRLLEEKINAEYYKNKFPWSPHSGIGQEAVGIGACTFLRKDDWIIPTHRGFGHLIGKGVDPKRIAAEYYGKKTGCSKGKGGFHIAELELGVPGITGVLGGQFVLAVGLGLAAQMNGKQQVVLGFFGEGTSRRGTLHEAMNAASIWKLPVVWICENNAYMMNTSVRSIIPTEDVADIAGGYGMPGVTANGQDVVAVFEAVQSAVDRARSGEGPSLIELKTYRFRPHAEGMFLDARPKEVLEQMQANDPVFLFRDKLLSQGILTNEKVDQIQQDANQEMDAAIRFADESPYPEPEEAFQDLFAN